jgi:hypothetical protein
MPRLACFTLLVTTLFVSSASAQNKTTSSSPAALAALNVIAVMGFWPVLAETVELLPSPSVE